MCVSILVFHYLFHVFATLEILCVRDGVEQSMGHDSTFIQNSVENIVGFLVDLSMECHSIGWYFMEV